MDLHLNVVTRPWTEAGFYVLVFVIMLVVIGAARLAGAGLPEAITMAVAAGWAAGAVTRPVPSPFLTGDLP